MVTVSSETESKIIAIMKEKPLSVDDLRRILNKKTYSQVIITMNELGFRYPIWNPAKGMFKVLTDKDLENYAKA